MRLLITGGAGFIGSCFILHMMKKYPDYQIINLDKLTYAANPDFLREVANNPNYTFVEGDICDSELVSDLMGQVDGCINFAAESHVDRSIKNPQVFVQTNVNGTLNLLHHAKVNNISRYLQVSTDEVYGSLGPEGYFTEETPLAPNSPYSASKAAGDMLVRAYYETYGMPVVTTRCSNNYGPHQDNEKLIPSFITKAWNNEKLPVYGDGLNIRDWLYVYDHCEGIDIVFHKGREGEVYNIGGHNEKTNMEITNIILESLDKDDSLIQYVEDRLGHDRRYAIDPSKMNEEFGWLPKVKFEDGIQMTLAWYKEQFAKAAV